MGCGCGKTVVRQAESITMAAAGVAATPRIAVYEVVSADGEMVTSTTSPVAARQEARRVGGGARVRVTSRETDAAELIAAGMPAPS